MAPRQPDSARALHPPGGAQRRRRRAERPSCLRPDRDGADLNSRRGAVAELLVGVGAPAVEAPARRAGTGEVGAGFHRRPVRRPAGHLDRDAGIGVGAGVAELAEEVVAPAEQAPACGPAAGVRVAGGHRRPGPLTTDLDRRLLVGVGTTIAELAFGVVSPTPEAPGAAPGTGVVHAGADLGPVGGAAGDLHRRLLLRARSAVADLALAIVAPAPEPSGAAQ